MIVLAESKYRQSLIIELFQSIYSIYNIETRNTYVNGSSLQKINFFSCLFLCINRFSVKYWLIKCLHCPNFGGVCMHGITPLLKSCGTLIKDFELITFHFVLSEKCLMCSHTTVIYSVFIM